jgi:hypothetical protein
VRVHQTVTQTLGIFGLIEAGAKEDARDNVNGPRQTLLTLLLALLMGATLPLSPYLLKENARAAERSKTEHHHADHQHSKAPDDHEHVHCLKCLLVVSSLPKAAMVLAELQTRATGLAPYTSHDLPLRFDPNTGARAPPRPLQASVLST